MSENDAQRWSHLQSGCPRVLPLKQESDVLTHAPLQVRRRVPALATT